MRNSRGFMTVDYMFAFFLVAGFSLVIMTFSATLSMVEVVQYMTFATARNYFAGNISEEKQKEAAFDKWVHLKKDRAVSHLLNGGWFYVPDNSLIVDYNIPEKYPAFKDYGAGSEINLFHGAIVTFQARVLDFQVPFFGSTKAQGQGQDSNVGFTTSITSFLGREPSFDECADFDSQRWQRIKQLPNNVGAQNYSAATSNDYVVIHDNGC